MQGSIARLIAAAGGIASLAGFVAAQPFVVNVTGATLQEELFEAEALTNDFNDIDNDGNITPTLVGALVDSDQLAATQQGSFPIFIDNTVDDLNGDFFVVQYRQIGSINGFQEVLAFSAADENGATARMATLGDASTVTPFDVFVNDSGIADELVISSADLDTNTQIVLEQLGSTENVIQVNRLVVNPVVTSNPGGLPARSSFTDFSATFDGTGGVQMDIAIIDVPGSWAGRGPVGTPAFDATPTSAGYGQNPLQATDKDGTVFTTQNTNGQSNTLPDPFAFGRNTNLAMPNVNTLYDTAVTFTPIAALVNAGLGISQIDFTDLQHCYATGRLKSGLNPACITRDVGSGTRNGWSNSIGVEPSWAVGENIGPRQANNDLGPNYVPSNKSGSGNMEASTQNNRVAIGYTGAERGDTRWLLPRAASDPFDTNLNQRLDVLAVRNDHIGGTVFARPTIQNVLNNDENGFRIAGPATWTTVGDPKSSLNTLTFMRDGSPVDANLGTDNTNTNPAMANPAAAGFINNIIDSIAAFAMVPGSFDTLGTPGEFIAATYIPFGALNNTQNLGNPTQFDAQVANVALQNVVIANNDLSNPAYATAPPNFTGIVPSRETFQYSDELDAGVANGDNYVAQDGDDVNEGDDVNLRNKIAFDFANNGARDINDFAAAVAAYDDRNDAANGTLSFLEWDGDNDSVANDTDDPTVVEILGDLNGDGSYTAEDIRMAADGFYLDTDAGIDVDGDTVADPTLDRFAAFEAVDNASATQDVFATLSTDANDQSARVALSARASANAVPAAGNFFGTQIAAVGGSAASIASTYTAGYSAADIAGADTNARSREVLIELTNPSESVSLKQNRNVTPGAAPTGADGIVDLNDANYVVDSAGEWLTITDALDMDLSADMNGDLVVDALDVCFVVTTVIGAQLGDLDLDGDTADDVATIQANIGIDDPTYTDGDLNADGQVTILDVNIANGTVDPCAEVEPCPGDTNGDNRTDATDFFAVIQFFGVGTTVAQGNFDGDAVTDADDFFLVIQFFGCDNNPMN